MKSLEDEKGLLILLEVLIDAYCLYFLSKMCITTTAISNICVSNGWFECVTKIGFLENLKFPIECFVWKITKVRGCSSETVHIGPYLGKAKLNLKGGKFINFRTLV